MFEVERGGDVTFHGPGQLVGYPILDLTGHRQDLHWYLRTLEQALIEALAALGVPAERKPGYTGVWTRGGTRKIASIGIHVKQWVTWHGFALNVTTDLSYFDRIVPCGIPGRPSGGVCSIGYWSRACAAATSPISTAPNAKPGTSTRERSSATSRTRRRTRCRPPG